MFGRQFTSKLKPNSAAEFFRRNNTEIVPLLGKLKGFRGATSFVAPDRKLAVVSSFWETREDAEAYHQTNYAEVLRVLADLIEGAPKVATFEFASLTFQQSVTNVATGGIR